MRGGRRPFGYTIVEVMVVLAISGVMFVIAASFIAGKQAQTAFTEGTNELASRLQATISEVNDGQYSDIILHCTLGATQLNFDTSIQQQTGTNAPCVFVGKFLHFSEGGDSTKYETFDLAGARCVASVTGQCVTTLDGPPAVTAVELGDDLTTHDVIPQGLYISDPVNNTPVQVTDTNGVTHNVYGFGFAQSLGVPDGRGGFVSGGQTISMIYSDSLGSSGLQEDMAASALIGTLKPASSATVCVTDGTRYAQILIGNNDNQLTAAVKVVPSPC